MSRTDPAFKDDRDAHDLAAAGYRQELDRTLGRFSSFAAGFSYISILTGVFQLFYVGFEFGGPAFFWTWPLVFAGQFLVALCFAELAAHCPLCGGVYQWSKHTGGRAVGWLAGWVYLASLVVTLAAVPLALQITLPQVAPWTQVLHDADPEMQSIKNAVLWGCVLIAFSTVINSVGVGLLARINNVGVFAELVGVVLLIVLLAVAALGRRGSPGVVLDTGSRGAGQPLGYLGAFLAAMLMASYVQYGFDTAGSLAEETRSPRRTAPRAILQALTAAAAAGLLLLLFALMAAPDLGAAELGKQDGGLPWLVKQCLGGGLGTVFLCDVLFAVTVCSLAVHTGTVRLMFAMARDNNLPFGATLSRVARSTKVPVVPAVLVGALAALVLVLNVNSKKLVEAVGSVAIVWANLAYLLVNAPLLVRRLGGWPGKARDDRFALGRWGVLINALAVAWGGFVVVNIGWPREEVYGAAWYERGAAVLFTAALLGSGAAYYLLVQRHKSGILPEHRAAEESHRAGSPRG